MNLPTNNVIELHRPTPVPSAPSANDIYDRLPPLHVCLRAFVHAKGKLALTAEDLEVDVADLAMLFVRHKVELYEAIQAVSLMSAFDNFTFANDLMKGALSSMAADTAGIDGAIGISKAYNQLLDTIREITTPKTGNTFIGQQNLNVDQQILESLNPREREALAVLMHPPTVDHD